VDENWLKIFISIIW